MQAAHVLRGESSHTHGLTCHAAHSLCKSGGGRARVDNVVGEVVASPLLFRPHSSDAQLQHVEAALFLPVQLPKDLCSIDDQTPLFRHVAAVHYDTVSPLHSLTARDDKIRCGESVLL